MESEGMMKEKEEDLEGQEPKRCSRTDDEKKNAARVVQRRRASVVFAEAWRKERELNEQDPELQAALRRLGISDVNEKTNQTVSRIEDLCRAVTVHGDDESWDDHSECPVGSPCREEIERGDFSD